MNTGTDNLARPEGFRETGEGIFYSDQPLVLADRQTVDFLKQAARTVSRKRARLCAHPAPEADQHDMLIVSHCDTYIAPHRHLNKSESFLILEGTAKALLFDEAGKVEAAIEMGPAGSDLPFFYRMPARCFHSLIIESELLVFVESTKGPFAADESENASWAPGPDAADEGRSYLAAVMQGFADAAERQ